MDDLNKLTLELIEIAQATDSFEWFGDKFSATISGNKAQRLYEIFERFAMDGFDFM